MNAVRARLVLAQRLILGDPLQLAAKWYLERLADARIRLAACRRCKGMGVILWGRKRLEQLCDCVADEDAELLADLGVSVSPPHPDAGQASPQANRKQVASRLAHARQQRTP